MVNIMEFLLNVIQLKMEGIHDSGGQIKLKI